jgi:hypothetical protein
MLWGQPGQPSALDFVVGSLCALHVLRSVQVVYRAALVVGTHGWVGVATTDTWSLLWLHCRHVSLFVKRSAVSTPTVLTHLVAATAPPTGPAATGSRAGVVNRWPTAAAPLTASW